MSGSSRKDVAGRRGGYTSLNLNQSYKGGRPEGGRSYGKSHGLQSLGKVAATSRRIPGPASLPSLRSENAGNDPTVNLVPSGGGGWKNTKEDKENRVNNEPQSDKKEPKLRPQTPPSRQQRQQQKHPPSPGRKFKAEFPSLEEQESMSKRELEELERRQREEGRDGERERSPDRNARPPGDRERVWRDPPSGPPHGHHGPLPPNMGPYPPPRGPYPLPPYHNHPYMMHPPPRPGMAPYGGPPMAGPGGRYPPPPHVHYRPPYHHNFPPPNPYEMPDPYKMPPRKGEKGEEVSRPPTVKADDLKSMEMPDDEEGGWAGHHEEVDYTKEVVFEDSSDDESMARPSSGEGRRGRSSPRKKDKQTAAVGKESSAPSEKQDRFDFDADSEYPRERDQERERERDFDRDSRQLEGGREGQPPTGGGPRPMHPPYQAYPSYPYQYDPYRYPQQPYPPHPGHYPIPPQSGYPPHSHPQRYGPQRGAKRGPPDREWDRDKDDLPWRHDFHPWSQHEEHRPKRRWSGEERAEERERPRILAKPDERKDSRKTSETRDEPFSSESEKGKERSSAIKRTDSASSDTQEGSGKPRVTFASDAREKSQSPLLEDQPSPTAKPTMRSAHPKKIMLRKLGGAESPTEKQDQHGTAAKGSKKERPKDLKNLQQGDPSDAADTDSPNTPDHEGKIKQTAWSVKGRGPITSPQTLYEPEGKKSAAQFQKYRRERVSGAPVGKGESGSRGASSPSTPPPDVKVPTKEDEGIQKGEDEKEATEGVQATSPTPVEQESSQAPENVVEQRKAAPDRPERPRRQDSGRQLHEKERNRQDSRELRDRGRHRREEGREKGGPGRQETGSREEFQEPSKDRDKDSRGQDSRDERPAHGKTSGGVDLGREKGGGFQTREFHRQGRGERGRGEHPGRKQDAPQGAVQERREADRRRDHPNEPRPTVHKDQDQPDRSGRGERHPSRPEPVRTEGRPRREERRPREKQFRSAGHERRENPMELPTSSMNTASEQQSAAPKTVSSEAVKSATSTQVSEKMERVERHEPVPPKSAPEHTEQKPDHQKPRDGRRDDNRRPERVSDRSRGGHPSQRGSAGDRERERGGRNLPRDREKGEGERERGRSFGEDRERERGSKQSAERNKGEREGRTFGKPPPKDRSTEHPERGGRSNEDRRPARDSRRPDQGEKGERRGGRQRERAPPGGRRMPPRGQERASERTHRTEHAVEEGKAGETPKVTAKPVVGYSGLEDIESGSDWEADVETIPIKEPGKDQEQRTGPANEGKMGSVPQSVKPHQAERGQQCENGRDFRRGAGRGRGRSEESRGERRGRESGRPGSQRRQGGSRDNSRNSEKQGASEGSGPSSVVSQDSVSKSRDRASHSEKKSRDSTPQPSHKMPDFDKYDLNSHKVAIVDEIGNEGAETGRLSPSVQGEFVEVTSKKAQKEKLKKEKEEQRRLDEEKRKLEEERLRRAKKLASNKPATNHDKNLPATHRPINAWGSNSSKNETEMGSVWPVSDWMLLPTSAAPGAQLKSPGLGDSRWPHGTAAISIGVIGDNLQLKQSIPSGSAVNPFSTSADNHTYSLFGSVNPIASPFLGSPAIPSVTGGSMLEAAVESTVPKLSQEALAGVSSEDPIDLETVLQLSDENPIGDETREKGKESPEFQKVERNRRGGKNLPPRFQSSKGQSSGPGRGKGSGGKGGDEASDRFYTHPKGRGDKGQRAGGERRYPQGSKSTPRTQSQPSGAGAAAAKGSEKASSDRFYVPPKTRAERGDHARGQKSSGDRRHPHGSKPTSKLQAQSSQLTSDSAKQSKVANTDRSGPKSSSPDPSVEVGPLSEPSPLPPEEGSATGHQQLRAGRNIATAVAAARRQGQDQGKTKTREDQGKTKTGDAITKTHAQVVMAGLGHQNQPKNRNQNQNAGSSSDCGSLTVSEAEVSQSLHAKEGQSEAVLVHLEQERETAGSLRQTIADSPARGSRPNGSPNLTVGSKNSQKSRPTSGSSASTKGISYAQALKADLSTESGSKLSSRSQTPSDSSALQSVSRSQGSSRASTPAGFRRPPMQTQLAGSFRLPREHDSRSQSAQSNTIDGVGNELEALKSGRTSVSSMSCPTPDPPAAGVDTSAHGKVTEPVVPEDTGSSGKDAKHQTEVVSTVPQAEETANQLPITKEDEHTAVVSAAEPADAQKLMRKDEVHLPKPVCNSEPSASRMETTVVGSTALQGASVETENQAPKLPPGLSLNRAHLKSTTSGQVTVVLPVEPLTSVSNQPPASMSQTVPTRSTEPTPQVCSNPSQISQAQQLKSQNPPTIAAPRQDALHKVYGQAKARELLTSSQPSVFDKPSPSQPQVRQPQSVQEFVNQQDHVVPPDQTAVLSRMRQPPTKSELLRHEAPHLGAQQQQLQALQHHQKALFIPTHALHSTDREKDPHPEKFSDVRVPDSTIIRPSPSSPTATTVLSSPVMAQGTLASLQTRNPAQFTTSAFIPYSRMNVPAARPSSAGHLQGHTLQFSSQPTVVHQHASQNPPMQRISQTAAQESMEREDREQSADSSKSSLSVTAVPFVPSSSAAGTSNPVSSGQPAKRRSTGSTMTSIEMPLTVPVAPLLQMHTPHGMERSRVAQTHVPLPQHALLHHQQQRLRAPRPTVTAVASNTAALVGHHQRLATAPNAAPALQTLLLLQPQLTHHQLQQAALTNPHALATHRPPQHVHTTESHLSAIQVIAPQNPNQTQVPRNQHEMSSLSGAAMMQRQHEGHGSRRLSHPRGGGDQLRRSNFAAVTMQARGISPNVPASVLYARHNQRIPVGSVPSGSERPVYLPRQTTCITNYNLPLALVQQKAASAGNSQKRPLLPTPPGMPSTTPFLRTVVSPGQTWPTAPLQRMHAGVVRPPYPHVQEQPQRQPRSAQY